MEIRKTKEATKDKKEMEVLLLQTECGTECVTEASDASSSNWRFVHFSTYT